MSLLAALSPLLTQATNLTGAAVGAQNQANEIQRQRALQNQQLSTQQALLQYQLKRQEQQDTLNNALKTREQQLKEQELRVRGLLGGLQPEEPGPSASRESPSAQDEESPHGSIVPLPSNPQIVSRDLSQADRWTPSLEEYQKVTGQKPAGTAEGPAVPSGVPGLSVPAGGLGAKAVRIQAQKDQLERGQRFGSLVEGAKDASGQPMSPQEAYTKSVDKTLTDKALEPPTPHAPVLGSPEYLAAKAAEEEKAAQIKKKYGNTPTVVIKTDDGRTILAPKVAGVVIDPTTGQPVRGATAFDQTRGADVASYQNITDADQRMTAFEQKLKTDPQLLSVMRSAEAKMATDPKAQSAYGLHGLFNALLADGSIEATNPELAQYFRDKQMYGDVYASLQKRPNLTHREVGQLLSGATAGAPDAIIQASQQFRNATRTAIAERLKRSGGLPDEGTSSEAQQLWDAAVKKYGEAKVLQQYGPRPAHD